MAKPWQSIHFIALNHLWSLFTSNLEALDFADSSADGSNKNQAAQTTLRLKKLWQRRKLISFDNFPSYLHPFTAYFPASELIHSYPIIPLSQLYLQQKIPRILGESSIG